MPCESTCIKHANDVFSVHILQLPDYSNPALLHVQSKKKKKKKYSLISKLSGACFCWGSLAVQENTLLTQSCFDQYMSPFHVHVYMQSKNETCFE